MTTCLSVLVWSEKRGVERSLGSSLRRITHTAESRNGRIWSEGNTHSETRKSQHGHREAMMLYIQQRQTYRIIEITQIVMFAD